MAIQRRWLGVVLLGVALLVAFPSGGWPQNLTVSLSNQQLYSQPSFTSPPVAPVPQGAQVSLISREGDWVQVDYQGKRGWLHKAAVAGGGPPLSGLPALLSGGPVRQTTHDEVALAGKGFTPEVEAGFRQKNPGLNYAQVDEVERLQVDPARLQAFLQEGGLN
jgi:uncharacterized protein YgiM (DUF1202 family)